MPLSLTQDRLQIPRGVVARAVQGATILLNTTTGRYFTLDEIGARVWSLVGASRPAQELYDVLLAEYQVEPDRLKQDLDALVSELETQGLIEVQRA